MKARKLIVILVATLLLLFGPRGDSATLWCIIRIMYLIVVPVATWFLLRGLWRIWDPVYLVEDRLTRGLIALVAGVFFSQAYVAATAKWHYENDMVVRSYDGYEAVGDDVRVGGPDWRLAFVFGAFGAAAFGVSVGYSAEESRYIDGA